MIFHLMTLSVRLVWLKPFCLSDCLRGQFWVLRIKTSKCRVSIGVKVLRSLSTFLLKFTNVQWIFYTSWASFKYYPNINIIYPRLCLIFEPQSSYENTEISKFSGYPGEYLNSFSSSDREVTVFKLWLPFCKNHTYPWWDSNIGLTCWRT